MATGEEAHVLQQHGGPLVAADTEGRFTYVSEDVARLLGHAPEDLVGRPLTTIMPERMRARHLNAFAHYRDTGESRLMGKTVRVPALHAGGHEIEIDLTIRYFQAPGDRRLLVASIQKAGTGPTGHLVRLESALQSRAYMLL